MNEKRLIVAVFGVVLVAIIGFIAIRFIAALTVSVFLYYSTRQYYRGLRRLRLPARARALVVLFSLAVPLLLLISYTVLLLTIDISAFVDEYALSDEALAGMAWLSGLESIPEFTVQGIYEAYRAGELDVFITFASQNAPFIGGFIAGLFLNLFIVIVVTYYLLVDGERIREWLLRFDDDALIREYLESVDDELEAVLFGNLLNVIATALIAIAAFQAYNLFAPPIAEVPYPTLAGALTGIASLVPVVGMKIVYLPLTVIAAVPILLGAELTLLVYIAGFLVVAIVIVDTIPDLILRPILSGKTTHIGLLMLAYTLGPVVLGFYGLFFAPIVLVVGLTFANTVLPDLLGADTDDEGLPRDQLRLTDF